ADSGEDAIVSCEVCNYAANVEKAEIVTPKTNVKKEGSSDRKGIQEVSTPGMKTVEEVTGFLQVSPENLVKTLLYETDKEPIAVLVRGDHEVNETKVRNLMGCSELVLAGDEVIRRITHAPRGFAGPIDLRIKTVADNAVQLMSDFVTGGNKEDTHIVGVNLRDFTVDTFADLRAVTEEDSCPRCNGKLNFRRGIEVGHIFKLGTKYSEALGATYLDAQGKERLIVMGCYGIGVGRTVAAAIEQNHDENGIIFPLPLAPFDVLILPVNMHQQEVKEVSKSLYHSLNEKKYDVIIDDRDESPGVKFKDADLLGIPFRLTVSKRTLKENKVELKLRRTGDVIIVDRDKVSEELSLHINDGNLKSHRDAMPKAK
ncbi:MAG: proline--tRNA ligase, partial [Thermodesulfobacteriota bacterium]|nr:proline--tRNA ligase [Thermodesulfobacteriota bacterium]